MDGTLEVENMDFFESACQLSMRGGTAEDRWIIYGMISFPDASVAATSARLVSDSLLSHVRRDAWSDFRIQCQCCDNAVWMEGGVLHVNDNDGLFSMPADYNTVRALYHALLDVVEAMLGRIIDDSYDSLPGSGRTFSWRNG